MSEDDSMLVKVEQTADVGANMAFRLRYKSIGNRLVEFLFVVERTLCMVRTTSTCYAWLHLCALTF